MSSYASLMVNLDLGPHAASRTALAVGLAERFHARLIGSASRCIIPALPLEAGFSAQTLIEQWREIAAEELQQIEANFIKVAKSGESTSLRTGMDESAPFLLEQAFCCRSPDRRPTGERRPPGLALRRRSRGDRAGSRAPCPARAAHL